MKVGCFLYDIDMRVGGNPPSIQTFTFRGYILRFRHFFKIILITTLTLLLACILFSFRGYLSWDFKLSPVELLEWMGVLPLRFEGNYANYFCYSKICLIFQRNGRLMA